MASDAKQVTNRRNAQKSTGPHDASLTRWNAVKHGLTAATLTAFDHEIYEPMLEHFRGELQPAGEIEDLLVQRIALYATRLHRAASLSADYMTQAMKPSVSEMMETSTLLDHASHFITGEPPERLGRLAALRAAVCELTPALSAVNEGQESPDLAAALNRFSAAVESLPGGKKSAHDALRIVGTLETKFQRYETQLENRLVRLLNELERIQRLRAGEAIPAPMNINVAIGSAPDSV